MAFLWRAMASSYLPLRFRAWPRCLWSFTSFGALARGFLKLRMAPSTRLLCGRAWDSRDGSVNLALRQQRLAQVVVGLGVLRVEFDGLLEAGDGAVVVLLVIAENGPQADVDPGVLRVEYDGPSVVGDCLVQPALLGQ